MASFTYRPKRRRGYALLLCMMVAAVCSIAVLGIFETARFETLEVAARRNANEADWAAKGGVERTIAMLLDDPSLRGNLPPIVLAPHATVSSQIQQNGQQLTILATATVNGSARSQSIRFTTTQLQQRIASTPK